MINKNSKIFLAGHNGMVGSAILRKLKNMRFKKIFVKSKKELNLIDQKKVFNYVKKKKINYIKIKFDYKGSTILKNN